MPVLKHRQLVIIENVNNLHQFLQNIALQMMVCQMRGTQIIWRILQILIESNRRVCNACIVSALFSWYPNLIVDVISSFLEIVAELIANLIFLITPEMYYFYEKQTFYAPWCDIVLGLFCVVLYKYKCFST